MSIPIRLGALTTGGEDAQQAERLTAAEGQGQFEEEAASFHVGLVGQRDRTLWG